MCILIVASGDFIFAQCPMCKAAAESNIREGGTHGLGLNAGILYLFTIPYLIVMTIGVTWWWKNRKMPSHS